MNYLIITVSTPTQAMKVKRILRSAGIGGEIVKIKGDDGMGCAHGVKIHERYFYEAAAALRASTISPLTTRSNRWTVRTSAPGSPKAWRTSSGIPPGSSVDSTRWGFTHTAIYSSA